MVPFMAKRYPESVKQSVCKQILDGSYSLAEIAKMNNIAYSTLFRWKSQLLPQGALCVRVDVPLCQGRCCLKVMGIKNQNIVSKPEGKGCLGYKLSCKGYF
jgi:hypothetical protein